MVAYGYWCKQRLFTKRKATQRFVQNDVIMALASIFQAMLVSDMLVSDATDKHALIFKRQMLNIGIDSTVINKPYLAIEQINLQHGFVQRMETLFTRTESYLLTSTKGISPYAADGEEMTTLDRQMAWKAITSRQSLVVQIEQRIASETERLNIRIQQRLNEQGQRALGLQHYIWRSRDDDKVRGAHAQNDDRIFTWATPPAGGHPGTAYNCRCYAEPYVPQNLTSEELLMRDAIEPVYPEFYLIPTARAFRALGAIVNTTGERLQRLRQPKLRREYEQEVRDLVKIEKSMRRKGTDLESIAREMSRQRRVIGIKYKDMTTPALLKIISKRNLKKFGDKWGPTVEWFRNRGDSWEDIIDSAKRTGGKDVNFKK